MTPNGQDGRQKHLNWRAVIQDCQQAFASAADRAVARTPQGAFNMADQWLAPLLRHHDRLLSEGRIVWGALCQANELAFCPGPDVLALSVYSADQTFDYDPEELLTLAARVSELRSERLRNPHLVRAAELLAWSGTEGEDAIPKVIGHLLPAEFTPHKAFVSLTVVCHHHLPGACVLFRTYPLLVLPDDPTINMILPCAFWPACLVERWMAKAEEQRVVSNTGMIQMAEPLSGGSASRGFNPNATFGTLSPTAPAPPAKPWWRFW